MRKRWANSIALALTIFLSGCTSDNYEASVIKTISSHDKNLDISIVKYGYDATVQLDSELCIAAPAPTLASFLFVNSSADLTGLD